MSSVKLNTWCQEWARKVSATLRIQEESVSADTMPGDHKYRWNAEQEDDEDNVDDSLPLLPASAILCSRGELETPVPSSRMSPWVANAATVKRMFGESSFSESIWTAVANAEPFLSKSPWIIRVHSVDFLSTITCLPAIVG